MALKAASLGLSVGVLAFSWFVSGANAAPQALALLSTQGPIKLACHGGQCAADFSSFCLQSERPSPSTGTPYKLADAGSIEITGIARDGSSITLDPGRELKLTAVRTQVAVRISIPERRLSELQLDRVTVTVGDNVTLLPVSQPGDANPFSEGEIALAKDVLRKAGSRLIDADGTTTAAVRWLAVLANELPRNISDEVAVRDAVVAKAVSGPLQSLSPRAGNVAREALRSCRLDVQLQIYQSYRSCLEAAHDAHLWNLNADYWKAVQTGS